MAGVKGRSGPPGHVHSRNNSGGKGGPVANSNAGTSGLWTVWRDKRVPAWLRTVNPKTAAKIAALVQGQLDAIAAPGEPLDPYRRDLLRLYTVDNWLLELALQHAGEHGVIDSDGKPTAVAQMILPAARKRLADLLPLLRECAQQKADAWQGVYDGTPSPTLPAVNGNADAAAPDAPEAARIDADGQREQRAMPPPEALDAAHGGDSGNAPIMPDSVANAAWSGE